jgi:NAD(P)-dependent dehydrogenase (short-subunit alcohol dehydrogenase family)
VGNKFRRNTFSHIHPNTFHTPITGTGFVAARTVAKLGGVAVLMNRKSSRVDAMLDKLKEVVPDGKFVTIECDLQDFDSVRKAAQEIKRKYDKIYCLSNNAGIMATPDRATKDGYDEQMQTNHLSHFLLTKELFPLLVKQAKESGDARVVNHSSEARNGTVHKTLERQYFEKNGGNLGGDKLGVFSGPCFERYCQSKLANSVFTHALDDKLQASAAAAAGNNIPIKAVAAHPGVSATNLGDHLNFGRITNFIAQKLIFPLIAQSSEDGTMGLLKAMMAKDVKSGVLYGPNGMKGKPIALNAKAWELDPKSKTMLWETSEAAIGEKFDI